MKRIIFLLTLLSAFTACMKESDVKSSLQGKIIHFDELDTKNPGGADVKVTLKNNSTYKETISDREGIFKFDDLLPGYYDLIFSKSGFDTVFFFSYPFVGYGKDAFFEHYVFLTRKVNYELKELKLNLISKTDATLIEGYALFQPLVYNQFPALSIYLGKDPNLSNNSFTFPLRKIKTYHYYQNDTLYIKDYTKTRFEPGDSWYAVAYTSANEYNYTYLDQSNREYPIAEEKISEIQQLVVK